MDKRFEEMKKNYDLNLNQFFQKENENQNLLSIIKNKENETAMLQNQLSNSTSNNNIEYKNLNSKIAELNRDIRN